VELSALHDRIQAVAGGMTYRALAEATSQHPETVRRYMQGQAPSVEFLSALCFRFDVSAQWLLTGQGPIKHTEMRAHALQQANPSELLAAIAAALERLTDRVDRIEVFVQTMEARVRAGRADGAPRTVDDEPIRETKSSGAKGGVAERSRAGRVADAVAERPPPDAH
jgi:transcriptional regulator with XRE-family HTH domain